MLVDKRAILQCLGCLMKKPDLLEECGLNQEDFEVEPFYNIVFSSIHNLYKEGINTIDCFAIDSFLSNYEQQYKIFEDNKGIDYCHNAIEICELSNFSYYSERVKKFTTLRFFQKKGCDTRIIYNDAVIEPIQQEKERKKLDSMSVDDIIDTLEASLIIEARMKYSSSGVSTGQLAGVGMRELKESFKKTPEFGIPLQSEIMTTIARGARLKKIYMRSASTGGGKTRTAIGDMCNFSIPWFYDVKQNKWVYTGFEEPSTFISTELEIPEVQTLIQAYVSGVEESHILDGIYEEGEEERVNQAIEYIESSPLYIEFIPNFSIRDIENIIKRYKREKGCSYFCFDYVHMSAKLISEVASMSRGMKLREDQILFLFIDTLKNLCNQLNVFILTMSQLNGTYKDSVVKDETMLRGAKNMADRLDLGEISLPPTKGELDAIAPILKRQINKPIPNLVRNLYKVRRGKLTRIKIWQYADLGTCRTKDLFVTDNDFKLIPVEITEVCSENGERISDVENIIKENSIDSNTIESPTDEEQMETVQTLFNW